MPWGNKHERNDTSGKSDAAKGALRKIRADVNAEAKRRVVQEKKAGKYAGNGGKR